jgi:hypothetical protein
LFFLRKSAIFRQKVVTFYENNDLALAEWSSGIVSAPPAIEKIGAMSREIESRQSIG